MRYRDIINERRQSQRTRKIKYAYHGTNTGNLKSILKNGLLANPPRRVFGDNSSGVQTFENAVYASNSLKTAYNYAHDSMPFINFGELLPVIVIIQYVETSTEIDEDLVYNVILDNGIRRFTTTILDRIREDKIAMRYITDVPLEERTRDTYFNGTMQNINDILKKYHRLNQEFNYAVDGIIDMLYEYYGISGSRARSILVEIAITIITSFVFDKLFQSTGLWQFSIVYPSNMARIKTRDLMKRYIRASGSPRLKDKTIENNHRITKDVKFKGKTRITGIAVAKQAKYENRFNKSDWNIVYGAWPADTTKKLPMESIGSFIKSIF